MDDENINDFFTYQNVEEIIFIINLLLQQNINDEKHEDDM